ncbi:MAG: hypothetical protein VKM17_11635 [Cyanobacteriota bacterium]|nr:hypothetical protein [Cyanobacteriota bacterium]
MSVAPKWRAALHKFDKNCRHRGSDEKDSPLLLELDGVPEEADVVIGGEQGDQAKSEAADGLADAEPVEMEPLEMGAIEAGPGAQ